MRDIIEDHRLNPNDDLPRTAPDQILTPSELVQVIDFAQQYRDEKHGDSSQTAVLVTIGIGAINKGEFAIRASWPNIHCSSFAHAPTLSFVVKQGQTTRDVFEELKEDSFNYSAFEKAGLIFEDTPIF